MSRSGYSDDCDGWALIRWRGAVNSAIKGARGQAFLKELLAALDAMPFSERKLVEGELEADGQFCAIGVVGRARGLDMSTIELDRGPIARAFGIAPALAAEIMFENDDDFGWRGGGDTEVEKRNRWERVRYWVKAQIKEAP